MEGALSGETEIQDQADDENWRAKDCQQRDGNDWNHELWKIPGVFVTEAIEGVQVLIVVVYCKTKVLLVLFSDRLLDLTCRGRSR
jgi:hypothetical protein